MRRPPWFERRQPGVVDALRVRSVHLRVHLIKNAQYRGIGPQNDVAGKSLEVFLQEKIRRLMVGRHHHMRLRHHAVYAVHVGLDHVGQVEVGKGIAQLVERRGHAQALVTEVEKAQQGDMGEMALLLGKLEYGIARGQERANEDRAPQKAPAQARGRFLRRKRATRAERPAPLWPDRCGNRCQSPARCRSKWKVAGGVAV